MRFGSVEISREPDGKYSVSVNGQSLGTKPTLQDAADAYEKRINTGKENENGRDH